MLKMGKKVLSFVLVLCLMSSMLTVSAFATSDETGNNQGVQTDICDNMQVKGTNSFGNLLTSALEQEVDEQEENNGINIFSVEVNGKTATAEFETLQEATLVVGIYDESGVEMLASGSADVTSEDKSAEVTIDIEAMPTYFYLKAFLVDKEVYRPLCTAYESPNYTQEMQEFFEKTTDDFKSDKVLNLDSDETNNFAVYDDKTKVIEQSGNSNQVASVDDQSKKYVIENADSSITSLKEGDIFAYDYSENETLIVKVKSISVSGTTATIYGDEVEINEVFDYVKIEGAADGSNAEYDPSSCGEGVTYNGAESNTYSEKSPESVSASLESSVNYTHSFSVNETVGAVTVKGGLDFSVTATAKVYITLSHQYVELKLDYSAKFYVNISGKLEKKLPLGYFGISPVPGVYIDFTPSFVVRGSVKISVSATLSGTLGMRASSKNGIQNISTKPSLKPEIKIEGTFFFGISLEPKIKILGSTITATMSAELGAEIKASLSGIPDNTEKAIHDCTTCISGTINAKASISFEVKFLNNKRLKFNLNISIINIKIADFYYSLDYMSFGFTTCPYLKYKTTVTVKDEDGKPVSGATVNDKYTTDSSGKVSLFLPSGTHKITAKYNSLSGSKMITINNNPVSATVTFGDVVQDSLLSLGSDHSGMITENGDLYMWGWNYDGQLGDGTNTDRYTPKKIMSNFKAVSLGEFHSGAITQNGDLYMWGYNYYGQLGDGTNYACYTPKKIMSNVKAVSLGYDHSGAITENGDLYMWGNNDHAQLGDGTDYACYTPQKIMSNVKAVSLGGGHSGAITENGDLYMWGYNYRGQLGDGTYTDRSTPKKIMSNVKAVSLGGNHSGAITQNGDLYMWGRNDYGQLGDGTTDKRHTPEKIMSNVKAVSLGHWHSGAITENGDLYMWGDNSDDQLGGGTTTDRYTPKKIMSNVKAVSLGNGHSGAITEDGDLYMWGYNHNGQLGDGTDTKSRTPKKITIHTTSYNLNKSVEAVSASSDFKTEVFTNLLPNEVYNFYSMKSQNAENPFSSSNLLYITQAVTDENGNLSITYKPDEVYAQAVNFVVPLKQTDLSTAEVTMDSLKYNGETQYASPVVILDGKTLVEGTDYDLHGEYSAKEVGEYSLIIKGRGLYTGEIEISYTIKNILGDVNTDGVLNVTDTTELQKYLARLVDFDDIQLGLADINGDGYVNIKDATQIQKYLAKLIPSLAG